MNSLLLYRNLLTQITERQKKLILLRKKILDPEIDILTIKNAKRQILNLLNEIKILQNRIGNSLPIKGFSRQAF